MQLDDAISALRRAVQDATDDGTVTTTREVAAAVLLGRPDGVPVPVGPIPVKFWCVYEVLALQYNGMNIQHMRQWIDATYARQFTLYDGDKHRERTAMLLWGGEAEYVPVGSWVTIDPRDNELQIWPDSAFWAYHAKADA